MPSNIFTRWEKDWDFKNHKLSKYVSVLVLSNPNIVLAFFTELCQGLLVTIVSLLADKWKMIVSIFRYFVSLATQFRQLQLGNFIIVCVRVFSTAEPMQEMMLAGVSKRAANTRRILKTFNERATILLRCRLGEMVSQQGDAPVEKVLQKKFRVNYI